MEPTLTPWRLLDPLGRQRIVWGLATVAALGAAVAHPRPTGVAVVDSAFAVVAAWLVVWLSVRARRWVLPLLIAPLFVLPTGPTVGLGVVAAGLTVAASRGDRDRVLLALTTAIAVQGLFRLDVDGSAAGVPSALAIVPCLVLAGSAVRTMRPQRRRGLLVAAAVVGGVGAVIGLAAVVSALQARNRILDGVGASRAAVTALGDSDTTASAQAFADAADHFAAAARAVDSPWAVAARVLPVAGPNVDALDRFASAAESLALTAADEVTSLDVREATIVDGRIDLGVVHRFASSSGRMVAASDDAVQAVEQALVGDGSVWLLSELERSGWELHDELAGTLADARELDDILQAAPWALGEDGARHFLVLFTNPAESRELGGFVGGYGTLTVDHGRFTFEPGGSAWNEYTELAAATPPMPDVDTTNFYRAQQPNRYPQNWTGVADFPTVASTARAVLAATGRDVDGVLSVDPFVLQALAAYTGPVEVDEIGRAIAPGDVADFLVRSQYLYFDQRGKDRRFELLSDLGSELFDRLVDGALPDPDVLVDDLGPLVHQRRLLFSVEDPTTNAVLERAGLTGAMGPAADAAATMALALSNVRSNKLDTYLDREITFAPEIDDRGHLVGDVVVSLVNSVPPVDRLGDYVTGDGPDPDGKPEGTWWGYVALYSSLEVTDVTIDGVSVLYGREFAYGMHIVTGLAEVPQGETVTLRFHVDAPVEDRDVRLRWLPYPGVTPDRLAYEQP